MTLPQMMGQMMSQVTTSQTSIGDINRLRYK